jgi:hypothetical protein
MAANKKAHRAWWWLAGLAPPGAVAASIAAGYPDPPNASQAIWLSLAVIFSLLAGRLPATPVQKKSPKLNYIRVV